MSLFMGQITLYDRNLGLVNAEIKVGLTFKNAERDPRTRRSRNTCLRERGAPHVNTKVKILDFYEHKRHVAIAKYIEQGIIYQQ